MRHAGTIHSSGRGLERVSFDPPLKVWRKIETWPAGAAEKSIVAVSPLQQTFLDIRADTALSRTRPFFEHIVKSAAALWK
jgi:hypothetical protein